MIIDEKSLKEVYERILEEETLKRDNTEEKLLQIDEQIEEIYKKLKELNDSNNKLNEKEEKIKSLIADRLADSFGIKIIAAILFFWVLIIAIQLLLDVKSGVFVVKNLIDKLIGELGIMLPGSQLLLMAVTIRDKKKTEKALKEYPSLESIDKKRKQYIDQSSKYHAQIKNLEVEKRILEGELKEKDYLITLLQGKIELINELTQQECEREESQARQRVRN